MMQLDHEKVLSILPDRDKDAHKGDFGRILLLCGSRGYTGAAALAAMGALRSGAGLVYLGTPESIYAIEAVKLTEAIVFPLPDKDGKLSVDAVAEVLERLPQMDAVLIGCGLGQSEGTYLVTKAVLENAECPVVVDADGINALSGHIDVLDKRRGRVTILTPHDGEFARLGGSLSGGRIAAARSFAGDHGCFLVLKGHRTLIASPGGNVLVNTSGNSGLAKGGSGDVLTGIIASLLAQGASPVRAAGLGVWLHGRAGDLAAERLTPYAMTPEDVMAALPEAFSELI